MPDALPAAQDSPVSVDGLRPGKLLPQGSLGGFSRAGGGCEEDRPSSRVDVGRMENACFSVQQNPMEAGNAEKPVGRNGGLMRHLRREGDRKPLRMDQKAVVLVAPVVGQQHFPIMAVDLIHAVVTADSLRQPGLQGLCHGFQGHRLPIPAAFVQKLLHKIPAGNDIFAVQVHQQVTDQVLHHIHLPS